MTQSVETGEAFAGFWIRVAATLVDSLLLTAIIVPLNLAVYGREYLASTGLVAGPADVLISWVFPAIAVILFWRYRSATPGKMLLGLRIADARTREAPATGQLVIRYFGYLVSCLPLMLGFLWPVWDARKQTFHDKLAGTVVLRRARRAETSGMGAVV